MSEVDRICMAWIDKGYQDDCFWEGWEGCPTPHDSLTPLMVMSRIQQLDETNRALLAERDELRQALEQARDAALDEAAKIVDPAANAKRGLWAQNLRKKAAAIRALQSTTTKEEE